MSFFREMFSSKEPEKITNPVESKNPLKSEHLKEGVSPIIASVATPEQIKEYPGEEKILYETEKLKDQSKNRNVDYYGDPTDLVIQNFKNRGEYSYVISPIDKLNKFSMSFRNCTGLVATGQEKETGENISFLSHEDPDHFLSNKEKKMKFQSDLKDQLEELKEKSKEGTVDVVIVGGNYFENERDYKENYMGSIKLLSDEVSHVFGFEPVVMTGPKTTSGGADNIYYDNEHRRLYIARPEVGNTTTESFVPNDIENQKKKWKGKL